MIHKKRLGCCIVLGLLAGYFYGMLLNPVQSGAAATFHTSDAEVESIWIFNPFRNWPILFTPFGLGVTAVLVLLICLITKRGYIFFSGYKSIHDPRGFDILPDVTHSSSGFLTEREIRDFLEIRPAAEVHGMMPGKVKQREKDPDQFASHVTHRTVPGDNSNLLCIGAPSSGKSRGSITLLLMGRTQRIRSGHPEPVTVTNPEGELFEKMALYSRRNGLDVKAINFLDMVHSNGWNCLYSLGQKTQLVQTVVNTIIQNTSSPKEADDFWSRVESNLLMTLTHYVCNLKGDAGSPLSIKRWGFGDVYRLLVEESIQEINQILAALSSGRPAKDHRGLFPKARKNLWDSTTIGLGNRLAIFQGTLVDKVTRNHDVGLLLPDRKPCAYFIIISAQDSAYRLLSSLFFSLTFPRPSGYARLHSKSGHLKTLVSFCLDEYHNIGHTEGISDVFNNVRDFNMSCQVVVQNLGQWAEKHPGKDWESQLNTFGRTLYMGRNDLSSTEYVSKKCGMVTISVTNSQMPLIPLFPPIYSNTRACSQTHSSTQQALMQPDEVLRPEPGRCITLFNHHKSALLCKLVPEGLSGYGELKPCKVARYVPVWVKREKRNKARERKATEPTEAEQGRLPQATGCELPGQTQKVDKGSAAQRKPVPSPIRPVDPDLNPEYTLPDPERPSQEALGMVETLVSQSPIGMTETFLDDILGNGLEEEDGPSPRR